MTSPGEPGRFSHGTVHRVRGHGNTGNRCCRDIKIEQEFTAHLHFANDVLAHSRGHNVRICIWYVIYMKRIVDQYPIFAFLLRIKREVIKSAGIFFFPKKKATQMARQENNIGLIANYMF